MKKLQTFELTVIALTKMNDDHDNKTSFTRIMNQHVKHSLILFLHKEKRCKRCLKTQPIGDREKKDQNCKLQTFITLER